MTWVKQILKWCPDTQTAFRWSLDFNNRLALDGRDPSSYGGILWGFGLFDRPSSADVPIYGQNSGAAKITRIRSI